MKLVIQTFLIVSLQLCAQSIVAQMSYSSDTLSFYKIGICGEPQFLYLTQYKDNSVNAYLITQFYRKRRLNSNKRKEVQFVTPFSDTTAKKLISRLQANGIDSLQPCDKDIECQKLTFLDGDGVSFTILKNGHLEVLNYDEIHPLSKTKDKVESGKLRNKVQSLVTIVDEEINLKKQYKDVSKKLNMKKYYYQYYSGISIVTIHKRSKKWPPNKKRLQQL